MAKGGKHQFSKNVYYLVPNFENKTVLMLPSKHGWALPYIHYSTSDVYDEVHCDGLQSVLGNVTGDAPHERAFTILYTIYSSERKDELQTVSWDVHVVETLREYSFPDDAQWVSRKEVKTLKISPLFEQAHKVVETFLSREPDVSIVHRSPWLKPGWFRKASNWMTEVLQERDYEKIRRIVNRRTRCCSQVLIIETDERKFFFKATKSVVEEPAFTEWLFKIAPNETPKILSVNPDLNAVIFEDFRSKYEERPVGVKQATLLLRFYANFQMRIAEAIKAETVLSGCPKTKRLNPMLLAQRLGVILQDLELRSYIDSSLLKQLLLQSATIREMCKVLESSSVPLSIVHMDFNFGNHATSSCDETKFLIFDWYDGCVTHPFLELPFLERSLGMLSSTEENYVALWGCYEPNAERRKDLVALSGVLHPLLLAVWWFKIAHSTERAAQFVITHWKEEDRVCIFRDISTALCALSKGVARYQKEQKEAGSIMVDTTK